MSLKVSTSDKKYIDDLITEESTDRIEEDERLEEVKINHYSTMPTASVSNLGEICQYIGLTVLTPKKYINGYFYKCVYENTSYQWKDIEVQDVSNIQLVYKNIEEKTADEFYETFGNLAVSDYTSSQYSNWSTVISTGYTEYINDRAFYMLWRRTEEKREVCKLVYATNSDEWFIKVEHDGTFYWMTQNDGLIECNDDNREIIKNHELFLKYSSLDNIYLSSIEGEVKTEVEDYLNNLKDLFDSSTGKLVVPYDETSTCDVLDVDNGYVKVVVWNQSHSTKFTIPNTGTITKTDYNFSDILFT